MEVGDAKRDSKTHKHESKLNPRICYITCRDLVQCNKDVSWDQKRMLVYICTSDFVKAKRRDKKLVDKNDTNKSNQAVLPSSVMSSPRL
jgi:hypothetical protein